MLTIFDSRRPVNPLCHTGRRFGVGLLRSLPTHRDEVTLADRQWAARSLNAPEPDYDALALAGAQQAAYEAGCLPL